jgi:mRNA interferase MazF
MKRGQIYYADLSPTIGSEQGGIRPVVIIQNDIGNKYSPTVIVAVVTTRTTKHNIPTHHWLDKSCGLPKDSMVMLEQIKTIDKSRLTSYLGKVSRKDQEQINKCLNISLGLV